jgi:hydrogenase nickel incorporation protein HypB
MEITVLKNIFGANDEKAGEIRELLKDNGVLMINLIGSPGSGKTTLLEKLLENSGGDYNFAIIEGDVATDRDARRLQKFGAPITLINTDGACHLEALSIEKAIRQFNLNTLDVIFIENVGNMVCPAEFDIGEHEKIAIISTTEGDDKPGKYPLLFRESALVILSKTDLIPYTNFNMGNFMEDLRKLNGDIDVIELAALEGKGISKVNSWINIRLQSLKAQK